ncbi:MAG: hypothetical protein K2J28_02005 [Duncaniella sp.]|nr:hypothetical protein [Duncaniella sp.]MDE6812594.1 hypothetical protein [Duncaniella sp.]MDE6823291.1 hypothetical protein [Duncaniella sp.]
MEFFKHHEQQPSCKRLKVLKCIIHTTLQIATLAAVVVTLKEVDKLNKSVSRSNRRKLL